MRHPKLGVMIARGDLAVEVGFERLSEVPRQILALCEAAHIPAIWATQVLETLAKTGQPSRAEVTDAAAAQRAECVMLNKGPLHPGRHQGTGRHPGPVRRSTTQEPHPHATHPLLGRAVESWHQSPITMRMSSWALMVRHTG